MSCAVFADELVGKVDVVEMLACAFGNSIVMQLSARLPLDISVKI